MKLDYRINVSITREMLIKLDKIRIKERRHSSADVVRLLMEEALEAREEKRDESHP